MALTQDGRLLAIETPLGPNVLLLQQLTGTEDLSQPFAFTLDLLSETPHEIRSGQYALADFNFEMPSASLAVRVASVGGGPGARFELYDYPGEYRTRAQGERLARLRLQSEETSGQLATGASTCRAFSPGFRFDLQGHYRPDLDMSYVLLGVRHVASAGSTLALLDLSERWPMSASGIRPGLRGERQVVVTESMTTAHTGGPRILTAPSMIMEMELTAQEVTDPFLLPALTTVGYEISIRHRRPTPLGERFTVVAELRDVEGRHLLFTVEAHNSREKIAEGTLRRTIVRLGALG